MITREQFEEDLWRFLARYELEMCADAVLDCLESVGVLDDFPYEEDEDEDE